MTHPTTGRRAKTSAKKAVSEILILADGNILAHNITPALADVLAGLDPADEAMSRRATREKTFKNALPN
jgi:hypothetical protein